MMVIISRTFAELVVFNIETSRPRSNSLAVKSPSIRYIIKHLFTIRNVSVYTSRKKPIITNTIWGLSTELQTVYRQCIYFLL